MSSAAWNLSGVEIYLARPRGFCSGVRRALDIVEERIRKGPPGVPNCVLHEIVHNEMVVEALEKKGIRTIENPEDAPPCSCLIFSAHGVSEAVEAQCRARAAVDGIEVLDATCPLVKKVHRKAAALSADGFHIILFGKNGHRETEGILGRIPGGKTLIETAEEAEAFRAEAGTRYACLSQTTMNGETLGVMTEILKRKIPSLLIAGNVCSATSQRQNSVKRLAEFCGTVLIVGSRKSSNTRRLYEIALAAGAETYLVSSVDALNMELFPHSGKIGIASGASAPEEAVSALLLHLEAQGATYAGEIS